MGRKARLHLGSGCGRGRGNVPGAPPILSCLRPGAGGFAFGWAVEDPGMVTPELAVDVAVLSP